MKHFILAAILYGLFISSYSQQEKSVKLYTIKGSVSDSLSKQPIEYAIVSFYIDGSTKPSDGIYTNSKGLFSRDKLSAGNYHIIIDFIGYKKKTINNISLGGSKLVVGIGNINLQTTTHALGEVTVTGQKALVENHIDKLTYNAEKDVTSQGGVATDILKKVPLVSVDVDGNVQVQGSSNIQVLINGKPSTIFGNNIAEALQAIPASVIKNIEVITSPGAKYDAEGTGGIINIILKEDKTKGYNGTINLSGGTRLENGSANLNIRKGSFGIHASVSGNAQLPSNTINSLERNSPDSLGNTVSLTQDGQTTLTRHSYKSLIGFDWDLTKNSSISGSISYNNSENKNEGYSNQQFILYSADPVSVIDSGPNTLRNVTTQFKFPVIDSYLDYKKKFHKEGQELDISFQSSIGKSSTYYDQNQSYTASDSLFSGARSSNLVNDNEKIIQLDYTQPLKNEAKLELGSKATFSDISSSSDFYGFNSSSGLYEFDTTQVNNFAYKRSIYAVYSALTFKLSNFLDVKLGGRFERTVIDAHFPADTNTIIPSYNFFMPTVTLSHSFKNGQSLKLTYVRRIQRPGYRSLNPFIDASDPKNINTGNPKLVPELVHNIELAYTKTFEKGGSIVVSLNSRYSTRDLQGYTYYYSTFKVGDAVFNNIAVNTTENVGIQNVAGLNIFGSAPITTRITIRGSFSFYDLYIKNDLIPNNTVNSFNYRTNISATYQFKNDLVGEFFGNFRSPSHEIQGSSTAFITYSFAFRKLVWNKKGSIGFTTTNPFNKYVDQKTKLTGQNFSLVNDRKIPYRSFGITVSYTFGKLEFKKAKEEVVDENN
jgi:ferric enterobactin receptor